MGNHPNMSYCQWQNTSLAIQQVAGDLEERIQGAADAPLSRDEFDACVDVIERCYELCNVFAETTGRSVEALFDEIELTSALRAGLRTIERTAVDGR